MVTPPRRPGSADPDELGHREFTKIRKGWDPVEVRAHLLKMAEEIKRSQAAEFELESRIGGLETDLKRAAEFDEGRVTQLLGDETARVLEAARTAAADIREKAEDNSARLVRDAQERAAEVATEADEQLAAAKSEVEELLSTSRTQADELRATARREADEARSKADAEAAETREKADELFNEKVAQADAEAERLTESAKHKKSEADGYSERIRREADEAIATNNAEAESEADAARAEAATSAATVVAEAQAAADRKAEEAQAAADEIVETATEDGRRMISEAREARERMLRDLAERRKVARQQLEALRAGRERLLEAFAGARESFDDATDELTNALPAARLAADDAARKVDDDLDAAVAELDEAIGGSLERGSDDLDLDDGDDEKDDGEPDSSLGEGTEPETSDGPDPGQPADNGESAAAVEHPEHPAADGAVPRSTDDDDDGDDAAESPSRLRLVSSQSKGAETTEGSADLLDGDAEPDSGGSVEAIFARLRADRETDDDDVDVTEGEDAVVIDLGEANVDAGDDAESDDQLDELDDSPETVLLDRRDEILGEADRAAARRLKRALSDQENAALDHVRRAKKAKAVTDALGTAESAADAMWESVREELAVAMREGAGFLAAEAPVEIDADKSVLELRGYFDERVAAPLRDRMQGIIDESDGGDRDELIDSLRSAYREWRNEKLPEPAGDLVTLAFNRGILQAASPGSSHGWVVDHGGLPCADGQDNNLAGAVLCGEKFPTGQECPPAHPGCRCLLVPADR